MAELPPIIFEKAEIAKLDLKDGDILVLKMERPISEMLHQYLKTEMEKFFPGHKTLILEPGMDLEVLKGGING